MSFAPNNASSHSPHRRSGLRAGVTFTELTPDRVEVRSGENAYLLEGHGYATVLRVLDGTRTEFEVASELAGSLTAEAVSYVLARLRQEGIIDDRAETGRHQEAAFWRKLGVEPGIAAQRLTATAVSVGRTPQIQTEVLAECERELTAALQNWGVRVRPDGGFRVILASDYTCEELEALNDHALASGLPWMLLQPSGPVPFIGPVFRPGITGCWACLAHRLKENASTMPTGTGAPTAVSIGRQAMLVAARELSMWIGSGARTRLEGSLLTLDIRTGKLERHPVMRRPQCQRCRTPASSGETLAKPDPEQSAALARDGGYRIRRPEQTLALLEKHVSAITGIAVPPWNCPRPDGAPTIVVTRVNGPLGSVWNNSSRAGKALSAAGKGMDPVQARVSCLAEAVERYSACFQGCEERITATWAEVQDSATDPGALLLYSEAQYESGGRGTPARYRQNVPIDWVAARSLGNGALHYLPAAYAFLDYPSVHDRVFCAGDSNGCASGNTRDEAILQGFFELVERDAISIWWYNRVRRPALDLESFDDDGVIEAVQRLSAAGRSLEVLDLTTDLPIPVFAATSSSGEPHSLRVGFGAHLDPGIALRRAISELHQTLVWERNPAWDGLTPVDQIQLEPGAIRRRRRECVTAGVEAILAEAALPSGVSLAGVVQFCVAAAHQRGLQILTVDLTRPEIGFPVVRVVSPGLRHYHRRLAPGRLFRIPVNLGWQERPLTEVEMNPIPPPL